jgi:transcription termination factor Rho
VCYSPSDAGAVRSPALPNASSVASAPGSLTGRSDHVRTRLSREKTPLQYDQRPPQNGRPEGGGRRRRSRRHRNRFNENGAPAAADVFAQPEFPQPVGPPLLSAEQLTEMSKAELNELAKTFDIATPVKIKKDELVAEIVEAQAQRSGLEAANGVLDILPEGYGFLRRDGYLIGNDDIYISQSQIRRFELRKGDLVAGQVRRPKDNEKYYGIVKVESVNGFDPESIRSRRSFDDLIPVAPSQRWKIAHKGDPIGRALDLFVPIGKGGRVLVAVPPRVDGISTLVAVARGILANGPDTHLIVLSIDGRPEDGASLQRRLDTDVVSTTFDEHPDHHIATAELVMERAKRLVEVGADVVIVLDSLTRLARAYGHGAQPGRAGNEAALLGKAKRYFGTGRACEDGGSLTIVATVAVDGATAFDAVLAEEATAIANCEITLARELATARIEPPVDLRASATRDDDLLLTDAESNRVRDLRASFGLRTPLEVAALHADEKLAAR